MSPTQLPNLLLEQSKDLTWMVNGEYQLIYANSKYLSLVKRVTGKDHKLHESALVDEFGEAYIAKWKSYYGRALSGEEFDVEDQYFDPELGEMRHGLTSLEPIRGEGQEITAVACQSRDITRIVRQKSDETKMIDASLDILCTVNEEGKFVYVSAASAQHWGYLPEELIGKPYISFIVEEDVPATIDIATSIINGAEIKSFVNRYHKKDGSIAYNIWSARWDETAKLMYCVARDGKEKIEQEEIILQSEQRFKSLVQEGSDLIGIMDNTGNYLYVSATSTLILGITPEEFIGRNAFEFIHPEDAEQALASLQQLKTIDRVLLAPFRFQNKNKEWRWMETVLTNMVDNPAVGGIVANSRDITLKIQEEQKLKLFESIVTNTSDAILITEAEPWSEPGPRIIYINEAFTKMTGYTPEELIGKTPRMLQGPNTDKIQLEKLGRAIRNWEPCEITTINYKKNGDEFWVNFAVTPVSNEKGWFTHWIAVERDITDQKVKELENELLAQISENFNVENEYLHAANEVCKTISRFGKFDMVELWIPNLEKTQINLLSHYLPSDREENFYEHSADFTQFKMGEGVPGIVWSKKNKLLVDQIDENSACMRRYAAKRIGLAGVLGIPLTFNDDVVGVLIIGTKRTASYLKKYTQIFMRLEQFIGSELSRKKLENDLSHLFDAIPGILCLVDLDGRLCKINKAGCDLLGYTEQEMLFHSIEEFIYPEDVGISEKGLLSLQQGESIFRFENRCLSKSGEIIWLSWYCNSALEEGLIYANAINITEEKNLRELNRQAGELSRIGSWEMDLQNCDGNSMYWSPMLFKIVEVDDSYNPTLTGGIEFHVGESREKIEKALQLLITDGTEFDVEILLLTAKGNERWSRAIGKREMVGNKCTKIYGSYQDITERKRSAIKLAESENRFRTILEAEPECIKLLDSKGQLLMMNPAGLAMIGADSEDQVVGKSMLDVLLPEHRPAFSMLTKNIFRGKSGMLVFEIEGLKGNRRWLETHAVPLKNEQGQIVSLLGVTRDITERKRVEEQLIFALEEKNRTLERITEAFVSLDANWCYTYMNEKAGEIFKCDPKDIIGKHIWTEFPEGLNQLFHIAYEKAMKTQQYVHVEEHYQPYNLWFENHIYPSPDGLSIFFGDITQRKEGEEMLRKSNERFEKVTEATEDAIWDWDILNHVYYRSKAFVRFFGEKSAQALSERDFWKGHCHPEDLDRVEKSMNEALVNPSVDRWELEYRVLNEHGVTLYVSDRGVIVRNTQGIAIRMVGAMTDISEQKQMTLQLNDLNSSLQQHALDLERSNEDLERFAFVASHDLQEPLRMISSFMELLKRKYGDRLDDKGHQYIHFATDGALRMKQIILDLLEYSRASRLTDAQEQVDMNGLLAEFKLLRRNMIVEKAAVITSQPLPTHYTYRAAVTQVLHCLLDNALKYSLEGKPPIVKIGVVENETFWEFSIKDNGIGIEPQFHEKIFILFQRLHNKSEYEGTGIGLSVAKRHVEFLGGRIWLKSAKGEGTTFCFVLPKN